jgi:O-antigen/teichoic acid export membrane protein
MEAVKAAPSSMASPARGIAGRVVSNLGWSVVSEAVGKGVFFATNIYLARVLGVEGFGLFTLAMTLTYYFWLAVDLGTNMYGIREIARDRENAGALINTLLTMRVTAGVAVFAVYMAVLAALDMPGESKLIFAGCGLYLVSYAFYTDWVLKGLEKFKFIAYGSLVSSLAFLGAVFGFVHGREDAALAASVWSGSYFLGSVSLFYFLLKKQGLRFRPSFDMKVWWRHLRESLYFTLSGGLMMLYQSLPILLLAAYFGEYEVGIFAAPYRVITVIASAGFLVAMSFYPVLSDLYARDRVRFRKAHRSYQMLMIAIGLPTALIIFFFSEALVGVLFGGEYRESVGVLAALGWLVPLFLLRYTYGSVLLATGFHKVQFMAVAVAVVSVAAMGRILIPRYSVLGGAWALLVSEILMILAMMVMARNTFIKMNEQR